MKPAVSVVVPTLKDQDEIEVLPSLESDGSAEYELILPDDDGVAEARNRGIRRATTDKIVFLDDDSRPRPGYLDRAARLLDDHAVVAGRIVDPGDDYFTRMAANRGYDQGDSPQVAATLVGCNMAIRREVFEEVGMFDESLEWGGEDTLFAIRASDQFNIHYDPNLVVDHRYRESVGEHWRKQWRFGQTEVYLSSVLGRPVLSNWYEIVPVGVDRTIKGSLVKSVGKLIRLASICQGLASGSPQPEDPLGDGNKGTESV